MCSMVGVINMMLGMVCYVGVVGLVFVVGGKVDFFVIGVILIEGGIIMFN